MHDVLKDRTILICKGAHCSKLGAENIYATFKKLIKENQLSNYVKIEEIDCQKFCKFGPIAIIHPDKILYVKLKPDDLNNIIDQHIKDNKIITRLLYRDPKTGKIYESPDQIHAAKSVRKEQKKEKGYPILKKEKLKAEYKQQKQLIKAQGKALIESLKNDEKENSKNEFIVKKNQIKSQIRVQKEKMKAQKKQLKNVK